MIFIKYILIFFIIGIFSYIGQLYSKKYINRVKELEKFKMVFNILKTKMQFTYKPLKEIFCEISEANKDNIGNLFKVASQNMNEMNTKEAWEKAVENNRNSLKKEDLEIIKDVRKGHWCNRYGGASKSGLNYSKFVRN